MKTRHLLKIHEILLKSYGFQGWWPLYSCRNRKKLGTVFDCNGYHHGDYTFPRSAAEKYEIAVGAILTQNTAWTNVEKAIVQLQEADMLSPGSFIKHTLEQIAEKIKPSGYYNQKAKKLLAFDTAWSEKKWGNHGRVPLREELLSVWGIGPETADSILLYAFHQPVFVVDAYTIRIFSRLGYFPGERTYDKVKNLFMNQLFPDKIVFNEFHALIVQHAKTACRKTPDCDGCCLKKYCMYASGLEMKNMASTSEY